MKYLLGLALMTSIIIGCAGQNGGSSDGITYKNIDVAGAKTAIVSNPNLVILDVRTPAETAEGMIPNAIEIDYKSSDFESKIAALDKNKSYLVYCRSGGRSVGASKKMIKAGFKDVTNMKGGYSAWK